MTVLSFLFDLLGILAPSLLESSPSEVPFTILPLGDSITWGYASPLGNGYRLALSQHLLQAGYTPWYGVVDTPNTTTPDPAIHGLRLGHRFVGTQVNGDMISPYTEGYPGFPISEIYDRAAPVLDRYCQQHGAQDQQPWNKPNVILVLAGTNDMVRNPLDQDTEEAPSRLVGLIDYVTTTCPDAAVLVATLPGTDDNIDAGVPGGAARVQVFNEKVPIIVQLLAALGRNVSMVDMSAAVTGADTVDGVHPNAQAYVRMGDVWWEGMKSILPLLNSTTGLA